MTKITRNQLGSAHIIIIVTLAVAILGCLSFIFWQNFSQPKTSDQTETSVQKDEKETVAQAQDGSYESTAYSFNYPKEGWSLKETEDTVTDSGIITPTVYTDDYAQQGMGLDAGALVGVYVTDTTKSIDEEYANLEQSVPTFNLEELRKTTINGQAAITYHSAYEGPHYHTVFIKSGKMYDIVYEYAYTGSAETHMDAYDLITSTFRLN